MSRQEAKNFVTVGFVALGCAKNLVDSEKMLAQIGQAGYVLTEDVENADVAVVNTCGFIAPAKQEALEVLNSLYKQKKKGRIQRIIAAGCLAQRLKEKLLEESRGIDAVLGLGQRERIAEVIGEVLDRKRKQKPLIYTDRSDFPVADDSGRLVISSGHWAYLRIAEGCSRRCSFCTIPCIRGPYRSKPMEMVLSEAEELVRSGAVELNLIAQDTSIYGQDIGIEDGLPELLEKLHEIEGLEWIRVLYQYPAGITERLIETMARLEKVAAYLDMPIQHVNNEILERMRRPERKDRIVGLIERLREAMPEVVLRTTLIAGFPGETDEQFEEMLEFVKWARFDALGCFPYYPEEGTEAAGMDSQLDTKTKNRRVEEIMLAQQEIAFDKCRKKEGKKLRVLIEGADADSNLIGRYSGQAPETDSICILEDCNASPGEFVNAIVTGRRDYDLIVKQIGD